MVGSADMTNRRALEPTMSMSLFKSPEYAQEVWLGLSCGGLSAVQGFLLLAGQLSTIVSICSLLAVNGRCSRGWTDTAATL